MFCNRHGSYVYPALIKAQPYGGISVTTTIKKLDQQRHELKALRYLLEFYPESVQNQEELPKRDDFQIPDNQMIYDTLMSARTKEEAFTAMEDLDLEETDIVSFLRLGGHYYHTYPQLVKERGKEFRAGSLKVIVPGE
jgi:hypothetical protein